MKAVETSVIESRKEVARLKKLCDKFRVMYIRMSKAWGENDDFTAAVAEYYNRFSAQYTVALVNLSASLENYSNQYEVRNDSL